MQRSLLVALLIAPAVTAFHPSTPRAVVPRRVAAKPLWTAVAVPPSTEGGAKTGRLITVTGNNVEVTPPMQEHAQTKLDHVIAKHSQYVKSCDVHLTVNKNPRVTNPHTCEVTLSVKPALVIKSSESADSMYSAMDACASSLKRKLRKFKERKRFSKEPLASVASGGVEADDEDLELALGMDEQAAFDAVSDQYANEADQFNEVVKDKKFNMEPISVEEAVLCLNYIDHDFYVFRNADTLEVNVVYKRNHGGVGHIQPN